MCDMLLRCRGRRAILLLWTLSFLTLAPVSRADEYSDLADQVARLGEQENFPEALNSARKLLELCRGDAGAKAYQVEDARRLVVLVTAILNGSPSMRAEMAEAWRIDRDVAALAKQMQFARADSLCMRRREILLRHLPAHDATIGECCCDLAQVSGQKGDFAGRERWGREALAIYRGSLGNSHPETVRALVIVGAGLERQGKLKEAEPLAREAVSLAGQFPEVPGNEVDALRLLALVVDESGRYEEAVPLYRKALDVARAAKDDRSLATIASTLAVALENRGQREEGEALRRESLAARRRYYGDKHPSIAWELTFIAEDLIARGEYEEAEQLARQALAMETELLPPEHFFVGYTLHALAWSLDRQGDLVAAEALYRQSLVVKQKSLGPEHRHVAFALDNLARIALAQGDPARAEQLNREALAITLKDDVDETSLDAARLRESLAWSLKFQGKQAEALELMRMVLEARRRRLGDDNPLTGAAMSGLASMISTSSGGYEEADSLFRAALALAEARHDDRSVSDLLSGLGYLHATMGEPEAAADYYQRSLERGRAAGISERERLFELICLGNIWRLQGRFGDAEPLLREAADAYDRSRVRWGVGLERAAFLSPYVYLARLLLQTGKEQEAWVAVERGLARALADVLLGDEQREVASATSGADSLQGEIDLLQGQLEAMLKANVPGDEARINDARIRLAESQAQVAALRRQLADEGNREWSDVFPLDRVQRSLDDRTAIMGWLDVDTRTGENQPAELWVYVIRNQGPVIWRRAASDIGDEEPRNWQNTFRQALASRDDSGRDWEAQARRLYAARIAPANEDLRGVERLVLVPSGSMLGIPVETFVDGRGNLVGDRFTVSYAPSSTVHAWLQESARGRADPRSREFLLVGDPAFKSADVVAMTSPARGDETSTGSSVLDRDLIRGALARDDSALVRLPRLTGSRAEVRAIAALSRKSTTLIGLEASEQRLVELSESGTLKEFGVIHVATHALVDEARPERSALVLSQVGLPDRYASAVAGRRIYTGVIDARDISRWVLDADLVTLSGCETALGKEVGGEGYVGFQQAFLQAGAKMLLLSLWRVEDRATALLMKHFYENWLGRPVAHGRDRTMTAEGALREAKHWLRTYETRDGRRPYSHPYYWSAFVLVGTGGN